MSGSAEKEPARSRALYKKGQKCIVGQLERQDDGTEETVYYEAEVLRGQKRVDPETGKNYYHYWIHYSGWSKAHDGEKDEHELLRYDPTLLTGGTSAAADEALRKAKEQAEAKRLKERLAEVPTQLRLRMPAILKKVVLDDYYLINEGRILPLPRPKHSRPSVKATIEEWRASRQGKDEAVNAQVNEIAAGLLSYFDYGLRQFLLYQQEVPACDEALAGGAAAPSDVYGGEHLVRLLVKLPELAPVVLMAEEGDARNVVFVEDHLQDFMALIIETKTRGRLFSVKEEYERNPHWTPPQAMMAMEMPVAAVGAGGGAAAAGAETVAKTAAAASKDTTAKTAATGPSNGVTR